jgi:phosphatidylglycerol:prolipoprotein diacylglycerol transferase
MKPVLFKIPLVGWNIYSYGVMLGLSFIVGWYLALYLGGREKLPKERIGNCYMVTAISAIVGARLLYFITNLDRLSSPLDFFKLYEGGLVAYGGFLGGFLGSWYYMHRHRISLLAWADIAVPCLASGIFLTRIGCLLYGCDYGSVTDLSWGISFPKWEDGTGSPAYLDHLRQGLISEDADWSLKVHPTQLYSSFNGLILFGILLFVLKYRRFKGEVFLSFALYYAVTRFIIEFFRGDTDRGAVGMFSTSQFIGLIVFVLALGAYIYLFLRFKKDPQRANQVFLTQRISKKKS